MDAHGKAKAISWTRLTSSAMAGSTSLSLIEPVDWQVGDEVVIAPSRFLASQTEIRTIQTVSTDKTTLTLDSALGYDHLGKSRIVSFLIASRPWLFY